MKRIAVFASGEGSNFEAIAAACERGAIAAEGALVVCDGAERASVRLAVTQAVSSLTGLGSNKIAVVKMKGQ